MDAFEVTGYTKTGMYSAIVEAKDRIEAIKIGRPIVEQFAPRGRRWLRWHASYCPFLFDEDEGEPK